MNATEIKINTIFIFLFLLMATSCKKKDQYAGHDQYTCPMHPTVVQDKPGTCPVCGMDLVRKGQPGQEVKITSELNYLLKPTNAMIVSSIKTVMPVQKNMKVGAKANGLITYDTRRFTSMPIRFPGRIEKLWIKYNFQPVRKGQKILEIYSPELLTAQRDLLYLVKSDAENSQLIEGAKEKLKLLGVTDIQINQLVSAGQESYSFSVYSPADGYVVEDAVLTALAQTSQSTSSSMDGGMDGSSSAKAKQSLTPFSNGELLTREGMYVNTGQSIFKIVNTDYVWAEFDVYQRDASFIKVDDHAQLIFDTSETLKAKVNFIQPFFKGGESFVKVRMYLPNPGKKFRVGQLVTASFNRISEDSIWIPLSARLDLGIKEIAFVKRRGVFRPKEIVTGRQSGDWIEISSGLETSDSVAYNAQFMVDSEGFIKVRN